MGGYPGGNAKPIKPQQPQVIEHGPQLELEAGSRCERATAGTLRGNVTHNLSAIRFGNTYFGVAASRRRGDRIRRISKFGFVLPKCVNWLHFICTKDRRAAIKSTAAAGLKRKGEARGSGEPAPSRWRSFGRSSEMAPRVRLPR
jgi:hypothetical protein